MYGKYPLFYKSPKNCMGILRTCANNVYQASPRGGGWGRGYTRYFGLEMQLPAALQSRFFLFSIWGAVMLKNNKQKGEGIKPPLLILPKCIII